MHTPEPASGAAQYVYELVKSLADHHTPLVLLCPINFAYRYKLSKKVVVVCTAIRGTGAANLLTRIVRNLKFFITTCVEQMAVLKPGDIIHFQFVQYFPPGLIPFVLARLQGCHVVFTAHDPVPHKWLLPASIRFLERSALHCAYTLSARIIVHNEVGRQLLVREFSQDPSKIAVIPHGPFSIGGTSTETENSGPLKLLVFGSIRENKGLHLAIKAVQQINAGGIKTNLVIAGALANAREREYWADCLATVAEAPAGISIIERFITDEETPALLKQCHAMLLPYTGFSSESGVAALALANSRPLIATKSGGLGTLLDAADLGIEITQATASCVADAIRQALHIGTAGLREKGVRGALYIQQNRSWDVIAKRTQELYLALWRNKPLKAAA